MPRLSERRTGSFSPLRYPGGKGKLAKFMIELVRKNGLSDGTYIEPYAGGAAIAWELLLKGIMRRVEINDVSAPVHAFWDAALDRTDDFCRKIAEVPVTVEGIENAETHERVLGLGCDLGQGWYFGKPMSAHHAEQMLRGSAGLDIVEPKARRSANG